MSSTRTVVECDDCSEARQMGIVANCKTCQGGGLVEKVYVVQCIVRLAQFLPLKLPALHLMGARQSHIKYLDTNDAYHRDAVLRDRALDGLQAAAGRVARHHYAQHGSRLLQGRATISRRGVLTVCVTSKKSKARRFFDIDDGAEGRIVETTSSTSPSMPDSLAPPPLPPLYADGDTGAPPSPSSSLSSSYGRKTSFSASLRHPQHTLVHQHQQHSSAASSATVGGSSMRARNASSPNLHQGSVAPNGGTGAPQGSFFVPPSPPNPQPPSMGLAQSKRGFKSLFAK